MEIRAFDVHASLVAAALSAGHWCGRGHRARGRRGGPNLREGGRPVNVSKRVREPRELILEFQDGDCLGVRKNGNSYGTSQTYLHSLSPKL
jgi:hypothetical protein